MPRILERNMEETIESHFLNSGYRKRDSGNYDKSLCLDVELLFEFLLKTQKEKWESYQKQLGDSARKTLLDKIQKEISERGTLSLFRKPFASYGVYFEFVYFKPVSGLNLEHQAKYKQNIFSVVRQLHYSKENQNSVDIVLFVNGFPIVTMELKNKMTGSSYNVESAIKQYKARDVREPFFQLGRAFVHFALDENLVYMTTHIQGEKTNFLPFNKGNHGDAGNPITEGYSTEYLWKEILSTDSLLDLLQNFIYEKKVLDENGKPTEERKILFPRYHQLDCVRKVLEHAKEHGTGQSYLIQHSAGSGKSNTISWLVHQLAHLHNANNQNVFDSILVLTDRRILDSQLRESVKAFEQVEGVVAGIERGSAQLKQELEAGRKIIISTLQKFPYIEEEVKKLPGKRFGIIIDEAHSSTSGEMAKSVRKVLNLESEEKEDEEQEEKTYEDEIDALIEQQMKARGRQPNISYFAFTATPKPKTLELFGTKNPDGTYSPFHIYTMRQAIQEGFIKDVLANYTTYKTYFQLIKKIQEDPNYDKSKATRLLLTYVEHHELTIQKKTQIIINHFLENCLHELNGQAKAMLVCSSRAQAVKYKLAFDKYIKENNLNSQALVAFSGEIEEDIAPNVKNLYSEERMNGFPETQTAAKFKESEYKFLIVANKFQTGFDEPRLYAMYINKKLEGVNAVQTISRLNRVYHGKKDPITLDFVNDAQTIQRAFQTFYEDVILEEGTDPDKLYDLKRTLDEFGYYSEQDIENFARVYFNENFQQESLLPFLEIAIQNYNRESDAQRKNEFRSILKTYIRVYAFLSQIISFYDVKLEKFYVFARVLIRKLSYEKEPIPYELTRQVDLYSIRVQYSGRGITLKTNEGGRLQAGEETPTVKKEEEKEPLSEILKSLNERYATNFDDSDTKEAEELLAHFQQDVTLANAVKVNPKENVWLAFEKKFEAELKSLLQRNLDFYKKLTNNEKVKQDIMRHMFHLFYESVRQEV